MPGFRNPVFRDERINVLSVTGVVVECGEDHLYGQMRQVNWNLLGTHAEIPKLRHRSNWSGGACENGFPVPKFRVRDNFAARCQRNNCHQEVPGERGSYTQIVTRGA